MVRTYEEFKEYVMGSIKNYLPDSYENAEVRIHQILKNNDRMLDGMVVKLPDSNMAPTVYLNDFYKEYLDNEDISSTMMHIADIFKRHGEVSLDFDISNITNYEMIKNRLEVRVVNYDQNRTRLDNIPHKSVEDLAFIYAINVSLDKDGAGAITINESIFKEWNITVDELHEQAMFNSVSLRPLRIQSLTEVILNMYPFDIESDEYMMLQDAVEDMKNSDMEMFVVTNPEKLNGAVTLFYPDAMERISKELGSGFYVLPSSIHECLVIRDRVGLSPEELREMVKEVNKTQVDHEERLSDNIYHYDANSKKLDMVVEQMQPTRYIIKDLNR